MQKEVPHTYGYVWESSGTGDILRTKAGKGDEGLGYAEAYKNKTELQ